jgi:hypothetical protein
MKYFPILLSKAGEFKALQQLTATVKSDIAPIIEVIPNSIERVQTKLTADWSFAGNKVFLDFSSYGNIGTSNIADIQQLFSNLTTAGVNVVPVIQQNSSATYILFVNNLIAQHNSSVCIRVSNSGGGFINFYPQVTSLMGQVGASQQSTNLIIDLGYAEGHNFNNLSGLAIMILSSIPTLNQWENIIVASGSFPVDLSNLSANNVHRLQRFEWDIWNTINSNPIFSGIVKYGDYGNKNPVYGGEAPYPGSISIKYTAIDEFVIYRGVLSGDHPDGNGQYITFAARLIRTSEYSGAAFSWGDSEIHRIAHEIITNPRRKPGSPTTWVEITQNHHLTLLHSLL